METIRQFQAFINKFYRLLIWYPKLVYPNDHANFLNAKRYFHEKIAIIDKNRRVLMIVNFENY